MKFANECREIAVAVRTNNEKIARSYAIELYDLIKPEILKRAKMGYIDYTFKTEHDIFDQFKKVVNEDGFEAKGTNTYENIGGLVFNKERFSYCTIRVFWA